MIIKEFEKILDYRCEIRLSLEEDEFEDDTSIPERIPVAIEGPFTDSEIVELVNGGSI